jgi:hypothetical protein
MDNSVVRTQVVFGPQFEHGQYPYQFAVIGGVSRPVQVDELIDKAGIQDVLGTTEVETEFLRSDKVEMTWHAVVPHVLRHTFITLLQKEGVSLEYRQLLANHSDPQTTQRYSGASHEKLPDVLSKLDLDY